MRWKRTLQLVDVHCAGEIGRVVTAGILDITGSTMAAKLHHINTVDDSLRRLLCSEPRGGPAGSVVLLTPATRPDADTGMIILQPDQAHAMSGSNAMCAVTALLETGMVEMIEPETTVAIDTAAGLISAVAGCKDGKVTQVSLDMPPAFVAEKSATVLTEKWGEITYDLCYGGIFYGLVDVDQIGLTIAPENARELATYGVILRDLISDDLAAKGIEISHPETPEINGIAYVMFRADEPDGAIRTCTTLKPGRVDRSPCGTGSNANMAVRHAEGRVAQGDVLRSRSIIGGEFTAEFLGTQSVGPYQATKSRISGQCWIYGISQIGLDPTDPFPLGFTLSDTWGA
ncbi:MAG: proline racemase family protein [Amylibacter sp.]